MAIKFDPNEGSQIAPNGSATALNSKRDGKPSQQSRQSGFWRAPAGRKLREGRLTGDEAWEQYWRQRRTLRSIGQLCGAKSSPIGWAVNVAGMPAVTQELLAQLNAVRSGKKAESLKRSDSSKQAEGALAAWIADDQAADMGLEFAISCLAAAHLVSEIGAGLTPKLGWAVIDLLAATAVQARHWQAEAELPPEAVVVEQILSCELPLTLSYLFAEMAPLRAMRDEGSERLAHGLSELLNGQGLVHGANVSALRPLTACWTRCRAIGTQGKKACWSDESQEHYKSAVRQALRWTAPDGAPLLGGEDSDAWNGEFLQCALRLGAKKDRSAAAKLLGKSFALKGDRMTAKTPSPAYDSEWSGLAVLRSDWSAKAPTVAVDYSTPELQLEVWSERRKLFAGIVACAPEADGKRLHPSGSWQNLCWFSDKDVDYLELRLEFSGGAWVERQILLARRDGILVLADHFQHPNAASLSNQVQIPLAPGLLFCGEGETRDALLVDGKPLARIIPLALPEWRIDPRVGELSFDGARVQLSQAAAGRAIACPLFVDLKSKRCAKPSTWRHLTVAESLEIKSPETAVGYRIQCGKKQWVYYRSLAPCANRTLLGQNTSSEFLMARFLAPAGTIKELIEIEG